MGEMIENRNQLAQMLGGGAGAYGQQLQQYFPAVRDSRPVRVRLTEKLKANADQIATLTAQNDAITATLADLDEHPYVERIGDAIRKLLG